MPDRIPYGIMGYFHRLRAQLDEEAIMDNQTIYAELTEIRGRLEAMEADVAKISEDAGKRRQRLVNALGKLVDVVGDAILASLTKKQGK